MKLQSWLPEWTPIFYAIKALKKPWLFEYFECVTTEEFSFKESVITQFEVGENIPTDTIKINDLHYVLYKMLQLYPCSLTMRYLPTLAHLEAFKTNSVLMLAKAA